MFKSLNIFQGYFRYLRVYRRFVGNKVFIIFGLNLMAVVADSFGIMMVLPLLKVSNMDGGNLGETTLRLLTIIKALGIPQTTMGILLFMGAVFLAKAFIKFVGSGLETYLVCRLGRELKSELLMYYTTMEYRFYIYRNTAHCMNVINQQIGGFMASFVAFTRFNAHVVTTLGYLAFAAVVSWVFTGIAVVVGLIVLCVFRFLSSFSRKISLKASFEAGVWNKFLIQLLQGMKYLKSTSSTVPLGRSALRSIRKLVEYQFKLGLTKAFIQFLKEPISVWFLIGIIVIQIMVFREPLAPIIVAVLLFYRALNSVVSVQGGWQSVMNSIGGLEMSLDEFEQVQENQEILGEKQIGEFKDKIVFNNVRFAYGAEDVLKDINLTIPLNTSVAIVGESGAGKSTMVDLITFLLKPQSGQITVDGIPHQELDYQDWRQNVGMVTQDTVVFDDTIANNISLWSCNYEKDEVCRFRAEEAAKRAYCHQFIHELPEGYKTIVGDRGIKLSGGQRQRLCIARELFKNPRLLILDEATSSLDTESEQYIQKSIDELKGKITVVIIAHRLSTIKNVEYIYVMDKGRIIEEGSYEELLIRQNSRFGRMVDIQSL